MSSKAELQARISACRREISRIEQDIVDMTNIMSENDKLRGEYTIIWGKAKRYDLTVGDTWRKNLTDTADEYRQYILDQIENVRSQTMTLHTETSEAIQVAREKIAALYDEISRLQAEIDAIEEQERQEAQQRAVSSNSKSSPRRATR